MKATPPPAPVAEPEPDTRTFYVQVGEETQEHNGDAVRAMLKEGMPTDTPINLEGDSDWHDAAHYGLLEEVAPAPAPAPAKKSPPWAKK